jgi:hypothetical protein
VVANPFTASSPLANAAAVRGNVCVCVRGGGTSFGEKALRAEQAGATAVLIVMDTDAAPSPPGPGPSGRRVTLPVYLVARGPGLRLAAFAEAETVANDDEAGSIEASRASLTSEAMRVARPIGVQSNVGGRGATAVAVAPTALTTASPSLAGSDSLLIDLSPTGAAGSNSNGCTGTRHAGSGGGSGGSGMPPTRRLVRSRLRTVDLRGAPLFTPERLGALLTGAPNLVRLRVDHRHTMPPDATIAYV